MERYISVEIKAPTQEKIIELYQSEKGLSLRYWGVASKLGTDPDKTLEVMNKLLYKGVLFRQSGYYQLNPPHLWKE